MLHSLSFQGNVYDPWNFPPRGGVLFTFSRNRITSHRTGLNTRRVDAERNVFKCLIPWRPGSPFPPKSLFAPGCPCSLRAPLSPPRAPDWYTGHSVCPWDTRHFPWRWTCYHLSRKKTRRWLLIGRRHYKHIYVSSYAHFSITSTCAMRQVPHV